MIARCTCGDTDCPSCGTAQGTRPHGRRVASDGSDLRAIRDAIGLTQEAFAEALGFRGGKGSVYDLESGRKSPSARTMRDARRLLADAAIAANVARVPESVGDVACSACDGATGTFDAAGYWHAPAHYCRVCDCTGRVEAP